MILHLREFLAFPFAILFLVLSEKQFLHHTSPYTNPMRENDVKPLDPDFLNIAATVAVCGSVTVKLEQLADSVSGHSGDALQRSTSQLSRRRCRLDAARRGVSTVFPIHAR